MNRTFSTPPLCQARPNPFEDNTACSVGAAFLRRGKAAPGGGGLRRKRLYWVRRCCKTSVSCETWRKKKESRPAPFFFCWSSTFMPNFLSSCSRYSTKSGSGSGRLFSSRGVFFFFLLVGHHLFGLSNVQALSHNALRHFQAVGTPDQRARMARRELP